MGQIIIDLPNRTNKRFRLDNESLATAIIQTLETEAAIVKNPAKLSDEDKADIHAAKRARKSELVDWEDARAFLDTLD
jgi:hypothetical protein